MLCCVFQAEDDNEGHDERMTQALGKLGEYERVSCYGNQHIHMTKL